MRPWSCPVCGIARDRDVNAAINLKFMASSTVSVCGEGGRWPPSQDGGETGLDEAGSRLCIHQCMTFLLCVGGVFALEVYGDQA
ncbi:zinc ribbon domain-containing protein [Cupriavidus sp. 8B]